MMKQFALASFMTAAFVAFIWAGAMAARHLDPMALVVIPIAYFLWLVWMLAGELLAKRARKNQGSGR